VTHELVAQAESVLAPLERDLHLAWWDVQVEATDANAARRASAELAWSEALADPDLFRAVEEVQAKAPTRSLDLLCNLMLPHQVPSDLRARIVELDAAVDVRFSRHRGVVDGVEVDDSAIKKTLRQSDDSAERRAAWEASKTVGAAVADDVRELARLRNEAARSLGHRDWFALSLAKDELDEAKLLATLAATDRATAEPFRRWKARLDERLAQRLGCSVCDLRPWHYADPFFQEVPPDGAIDLDGYFEGADLVALAGRTLEGVGLEVDDIIARSDLYAREGKSQHAFCVDIDRAGDVRVLANLVPTHDSAETMLHELGHGVYELGFGDDLPWLQRSTHLVATEGSALFFGALAGTRRWLELVLGLEADEAAALRDRLREARAVELAVFTRWVLVMTEFERGLYATPDGDLDTLWWELVARHQGVTPPDGRKAPDWAAKVHIAVAPVYYHTYLYGSLVALQLKDALDAAVGSIVDQPAVGAFLREHLFAPGQSVRWDELVEQATGTTLSVASLDREMTVLATP